MQSNSYCLQKNGKDARIFSLVSSSWSNAEENSQGKAREDFFDANIIIMFYNL